MNKTLKTIIGVIIILGILYFIYWYFKVPNCLFKSNCLKLKSTDNKGDVAYLGSDGKYYLWSGKDKISIPKAEYDYLSATELKTEGSCVQLPNTLANQLVAQNTSNINSSNINLISNTLIQNPKTNLASTIAGSNCNYYGYYGIVNDCGACSLARPVQKACNASTGGTPDCITGNSPFGTTLNNGFMDNNICKPCNAIQEY